jgi:hypothetical protein
MRKGERKSMNIGIPKEVQEGETRVALVPSLVSLLKRDQHEVVIEAGAGASAHFADALYREAGAAVVESAQALYQQSDIVFKVQPPQMHPLTHTHEAEMLREGSAYIGFLAPFTHLESIEILARRKITAFSMDFIPRLTRAQSMDALSAMSTVAGRMPGHMNVLLAEANVPYDLLCEPEQINDDFKITDAVLVIGANDVVNPAARSKKEGPLYGMPILNADQAHTVLILKRSLAPGFAGEDNELFYDKKTMMVFGDAKATLTTLIQLLKKSQPTPANTRASTAEVAVAC